MLSNCKVGKIILNKGAEDKLDFEFKGFNTTNGLESFNHYYLLEWRSHNGVDKGLENYSNYYKYNKQASAEAGLTIWYIDGRWGSAKDPNQSTGIPGEAYASIIDASQEPVYYTRRANSSKYDNFEKHVDRADVNLHDTPFGLHLEDSFFIDWGTVDTYDAILILTLNSFNKDSAVNLLSVVGFSIKSIAPAFSASNTLAVTELSITTGKGYCGISLCKNVIPSIFGISISKVSTSGLYLIIFSFASYGSAAVPTTIKFGSSSNPFFNNSLINNESSIINTLIIYFSFLLI
jgi:hypothetical protein